MSEIEEFEPPFYWSDEDRFVAAVYRGFIAASPIADSFSSWALGIGGLALGAILSGIGDFPAEMRAAALSACWWLVVAGVLAVVQKMGAMSVASVISSANRVNKLVNNLGQAGLDSLDWSRIDHEVTRPLFWPWNLIIARMKSRRPDNLMSLRYAVRWVQVQAVAASLEVLCLLVGTVVFVYASL
jgi:hypothetical protein